MGFSFGNQNVPGSRLFRNVLGSYFRVGWVTIITWGASKKNFLVPSPAFLCCVNEFISSDFQVFRLKNIGKFANTVKVKVSGTNSSTRIPTIEACVHRNTSLGIGMCPHSSWQKVPKGSWSRPMSPFEHQLLDVRTYGSSLESLEVSVEEDELGVPSEQVVSILLRQWNGNWGSPCNMDGTFSGDEASPNWLEEFSCNFCVLICGWFGIFYSQILELAKTCIILRWIHRDNDISVVNWSIKILGATVIFQSSVDHLLATEAIVFGFVVSAIPKKIFRWRFLRLVCKYLAFQFWGLVMAFQYLPTFPSSVSTGKSLKIPKKNHRRLEISDSPPSPPSQPSDTWLFPSTFHTTSERRKKRDLRLNFHVLHNLVYKCIQSLFSKETIKDTTDILLIKVHYLHSYFPKD